MASGEIIERAVKIWRCPKCGHMVAKIRLEADSYVQVRCKACGNISEQGSPEPVVDSR